MPIFANIKAKKQWELASESRANLILQNIEQQAHIDELLKILKVFCEQFEATGDMYPDQILNAYKSVEIGREVIAKVEGKGKCDCEEDFYCDNCDTLIND